MGGEIQQSKIEINTVEINPGDFEQGFSGGIAALNDRASQADTNTTPILPSLTGEQVEGIELMAVEAKAEDLSLAGQVVEEILSGKVSIVDHVGNVVTTYDVDGIDGSEPDNLISDEEAMISAAMILSKYTTYTHTGIWENAAKKYAEVTEGELSAEFMDIFLSTVPLDPKNVPNIHGRGNDSGKGGGEEGIELGWCGSEACTAPVQTGDDGHGKSSKRTR